MISLITLILAIFITIIFFFTTDKFRKRKIKRSFNNFTNSLINMNKSNTDYVPISELVNINWDYGENGNNWNIPSNIFSSPININKNDIINLKNKFDLNFHYPKKDALMFGNNNNNVIYFINNDYPGFVEFDNKFYKLKEINLHLPSEHQIDSIQYNSEIQFIHKSTDNKLLIVSVLVEYKESCQDKTFYKEFFEDLLDDLPNYSNYNKVLFKGEKKKLNLHNLFQKRLKGSNYFYYEGSSTYPTYDKKLVNWIIFEKKINIHERIRTIDGLNNNIKYTQKIYDRPIFYCKYN
jgi:carbonic anhydrase